jgi:glycosyltransferase involved in cell wall biosynthesis
MTGQPAAPRVSVGLAVYNGERYLARVIELLLGQTYGDLELIICDNDSTDCTADICKEFVAKDKRVRYYRNPFNVGGVRNENRTYFLSRGEFFKLAAHDDLISPNFIEVAVSALDRDPGADICVPRVIVIDGDDNELADDARVAGLEETPSARMRALADEGYMCEATYGLVRMSALRAVKPQGNFLSSDRIMLCELATRGPFRYEPDSVLYRRLHEGNAFRDWRARMAWFQPELKRSGKVRLPFWHQLFGYLAMIGRTPLGFLDRVRCTLEVVRWSVKMSRSLVADVVYAMRMILMGRSRRQARYMGEGRVATTKATGPTRRTVSTAVLVMRGDSSPSDAAVIARQFLESVDQTVYYPTVLATADLEQNASELLDTLREQGVPVMVARPDHPLVARSRKVSNLLELAFWLRAADAKAVYIAAGDEELGRTIGHARRFAPGVESVVHVGVDPALVVHGGLP